MCDDKNFNVGDKVEVSFKKLRKLHILRGEIVAICQGHYRVKHMADWGGTTSGWFEIDNLEHDDVKKKVILEKVKKEKVKKKKDA